MRRIQPFHQWARENGVEIDVTVTRVRPHQHETGIRLVAGTLGLFGLIVFGLVLIAMIVIGGAFVYGALFT